MLMTEIQLATSRKFHAEGIACKFYKLSEGFGLKTFRDEKTAQLNYQRQKFFHKHFNFAPPVGDYIGAIECQGPYGMETRYGFITAMADMSHIHNRCPKDILRNDGRKVWDGLTSRTNAYVEKKIEKMYDIVDEKFPKFADDIRYALQSDIHGGNYGKYKGRFVKIDFSEVYDASFRELYEWDLT